MKITKKLRRVLALVACVAVMVTNAVLPAYAAVYAMDDASHYEGDSGGETGSGVTEEETETVWEDVYGEETDTVGDDVYEEETEIIWDDIYEEEMEIVWEDVYEEGVDIVWYDVYQEGQTFSIGTGPELRGLAYLVNTKVDSFDGDTITLTASIALDDEWKSIGYMDDPWGGDYAVFQGTFDGDGHTVSGLTQGLFGYVDGATIENLTVSGEITQTEPNSFGYTVGIGGIAGMAGSSERTTNIEHCTSEVAITITDEYVEAIGGIVGSFTGGTITDCRNGADISVTDSYGYGIVSHVGGILGYVSGQATIDRCINDGVIAGTNYYGTSIGGLVGDAYDYSTSLTIKDSHNAGEITSDSGSYTGGLVGNGGASLTITGSYNSGSVNNRSSYTGGLAGSGGASPTITDSYNTGDVSITGSRSTSYIGGVAGRLGTSYGAATTVVESVYNTGDVQVQSTGTGSNYTGGVAGFVVQGQPDSSIAECYNTGDVTGGNYTGGVFGSLGDDLGNITYCYNTGEVAANGYITAGIIQGGVAGSVGDDTYLSYCYNTGGITIPPEASITAVGGITGRNGASGSYVSSGFNIGEITAPSYTNVGGITGVSYASNKKAYYAKSIVNDGVALADANMAEGAEAAQVTNGWLAYMLDEGGKTYFRTTRWSQGDEYPVFAGSGHKPVYKVTLKEVEEGAAIESDKGEYVKKDASVTLTIKPPAGKILSLVTVTGVKGKQSVSIDDDNQAEVTAEFEMPGGDVTVTAVFVEAPTEPEYTVTYRANNGSGTTEPRQVDAGKRAEALSPDSLGFTNSGYTFEYWSLTDNGPEYDFNTAVVADIDLYAIWRANGTWRVTFNLSGSTEDPPQPQFVQDGETVDKPSPDPIWESGDEVEIYVFDEWCTEDGMAWDFAADTVTEDITLYAKWKIDNIFAQSSEENPAVVGSEQALRYLASLVNAGQLEGPVYVSVYNDITLANEWVPIGVDAQHVFTGSFDGGDHTISGVRVTGGMYAGLFGYAKDAVFKNITVEGEISTSTSSSYAGGIVGYAEKVMFENCSNSASVSSGRCAGGIVGEGRDITLNDCENSGTIGDTSYGNGIMGGIAGTISLNTRAENLINTGNVTASNLAGGIFGTLNGSHGLSKSYNTGNVVSTGRAGGIAGGYSPDTTDGVYSSNTTLELCYNLGNIELNPSWSSPDNFIGGIVGSKPEDVKIVSCYSTGTITARVDGGDEITANVGGIVGKGGAKIESCYFLKGDEGRTYSDEGLTRSVPLSREAFESGEAAWRLDKGSTASRTHYWSQDGGHPVFATDESKPVYRMSVNAAADGNGEVEPEGVSYYRQSSQVTLTIAPDPGKALASLAIADSMGRKYTAAIADNRATFNMPAANITVTPVFMDAIIGGPFTVSFHLNGGTGDGVEPQIIEAGEWAHPPSPDPVKADHIFAGWYDRAELDLVGWDNFLQCEPFDFNTAIIKNMELIACWQPRNAVLVSFNLNRNDDDRGSGPIPSQIVPYGGKITRPADDPTWDLDSDLFIMKFEGWYGQASGGTKWDFETVLSAGHGDALTLYARWEKALSANPVIGNIDDLEELAQNLKNGVVTDGYVEKVFELSGDITLTSNWIGLGTSGNPFNGTFNGADGEIKLDPGQTQPLFGYVGKDGTVSGVTVTGTVNSIPTNASFGGIAGTSYGMITDCKVRLITPSDSMPGFLGGIVGTASGGTIEGCTLLDGSKIRGRENVGGIAGTADGTEIADCETENITENITENTEVTGTRKIGGIVGRLWHSDKATSVTGCVNNADVGSESALSSETGGIAGGAGYTESSAAANAGTLTITDCENKGEITGSRYIGGIVGRMGGGQNRTIENCVNRGDVTARVSTVEANVGGIIGQTFHPGGGNFNLNSNADITLRGCENYGDIKGNILKTGQYAVNIGGLIGLLARGIRLTVTDCKVDSTVGADSESEKLHTIGGLIGRVEIGQETGSAVEDEEDVTTNVSVSDCSFHGTLNGDPQPSSIGTTPDANYGALGGVIGSINSATATGTKLRKVTIDNVSVEATMSGNSFRIGGVIGKLNGADAKTTYTLRDISVEGNMPNTEPTVAGGALGGMIGQMASFAGTLNINGSCWEGNFTDGINLPHGGVIGDTGGIAATAKVNITDVFMRGDFSGNTDGGTGGIIGNITSLADGATVALENAYWYGDGIHPTNGQAGGIIGNIGDNSGSLAVRNTYYGFTDGTEPAEGSFTRYEGDAFENGIMFKSKVDFERGEVSYLLTEGGATGTQSMAAGASGGVTWAQDWENKYPVFGEHRTHRITSTLLRQDSEGQLASEADASLVIAAKSPGSPSETAYDESGGSVEVSVVDIPEGYKVESISITGGSPESIENNGTFTLDGDAEVTAIIVEAPPVPPPPPDDEDDDDEDPGTGDDNDDGNGSGTGDGAGGDGEDGTGSDGYGLKPGADPDSSGDTGALYPLPDGDSTAGGGKTEGAENAPSPAKDETLPESRTVAQQPESSDPSAASPVEEQEPDETTESSVEGGPADESANEPKNESANGDAMGALESPVPEAIEDVVKSNLPLIIAVAIGVAGITAVSGFLWYRRKKNSSGNMGM